MNLDQIIPTYNTSYRQGHSLILYSCNYCVSCIANLLVKASWMINTGYGGGRDRKGGKGGMQKVLKIPEMYMYENLKNSKKPLSFSMLIIKKSPQRHKFI